MEIKSEIEVAYVSRKINEVYYDDLLQKKLSNYEK